MKEVIQNAALFFLTDFCLKMGIDCSGTHCIKDGRGFKYDLKSEKTGLNIASITFTKNTKPFFTEYRP